MAFLFLWNHRTFVVDVDFGQNVKRMFGEQAALTGLTPSPQVLGLLGPNGAGKSTLMRLIAGICLRAKGGWKCGQDVEAHPIDTKKHIGYLPEHNLIHLEMYVREYLDYVAQLYRLPDRKAKVEEVIERVGLTPEAHKLIGQPKAIASGSDWPKH